MSEDWRAAEAARLQQIILDADDGIEVSAKWKKPSNPDGVPTFEKDGVVCTLESYRDKLKLTFAKGASLDDPDGLFNASLDAGTRRAIDVHEDDELDAAALTALVRTAVAHNQG